MYGDVARKHPKRIHAIYIRNVTGEKADSPRMTRAFEGIARNTWHLFIDPSRLPVCGESP